MLTKTGIHAIRAIMSLARLPQGTYAGAAAIAKEIGAPPNYLGKLLQTMAREGIVESQKGLGGGFRLARDPRELTLFEIVDPIEQLDRWSGCILGYKECSDENSCAIHDQWKRVRRDYLEMLHRNTVAGLLKKGVVLINIG